MLRQFSGEYHIYNVSTGLSAYGYIYYASLSASESYAIQIFLTLLAVVGVIVTVVMITAHLCAIAFARRHLYKRVPIRSGRPTLDIGHNWQRRQANHQSDASRLWKCCVRSSPTTSPTDCTTTTTAALNVVSTTLNSSTIVKFPKLLNEVEQPWTPKPVDYPGVSIIKPLSGLDANLEANLASHFCLDYPCYEILFCVSDSLDPSCEVVHRLQSIYPHVPSRLIVAKRFHGVNPKINNLQAGYEAAQHDLLLISDSGIWMRSDTLTDMVACLKSNENIGIVHQLPFLTPYLHLRSESVTPLPSPSPFSWISPSERPSFAWIVQLIFFGCWHAKIYLCAAFFDINCVTGMSFLLRKPVLSPIGGFYKFSRYLAEDFFIAKYFIDQGWQLRLAHQPAWQNSPSTSIGQFRARVSRWSQLRLTMVIIAYLLEPLSRCFPSAILGAFGFAHLLPNLIDPGVYFLCHILIWFLFDYILLLQLYPPCVPLCITKVEYLMAWVFIELSAVPLHFGAIFKRDIRWRNKRYRVHCGGVSEIIPPESRIQDDMSTVKCLEKSNSTISETSLII